MKWSQPFLKYFEKNIEYGLKNRCVYFKTNRFAAFLNKTPINNISESLNKMVKQWNDWKKLPLDTLNLSLYKMQIFYKKEFIATTGIWEIITLKKNIKIKYMN